MKEVICNPLFRERTADWFVELLNERGVKAELTETGYKIDPDSWNKYVNETSPAFIPMIILNNKKFIKEAISA